MERSILKSIILTQKNDLNKNRDSHFLKRELNLTPYLEEKEITIISGVRRSGKSSLLEEYFIQRDLLANILYVNFEDPQLLEFRAEDFLTLYEIWIESVEPAHAKIAFFDEIQNVTGWERWMNFFAKQKGIKVFLTGSNSTLLSSELGTHLTGRQRSISVYPFSFSEIVDSKPGLNRHSILARKSTLEEQIKLRKLSQEYLEIGGFPRVWVTKDTSILHDYYENILNKDIVRRKKIKSPSAIDKLGLSLMSNLGRKLNKTKLAHSIGLKNGDTTEKYLRYFEECFLGYQVRKYNESVRTQLRNQTKFYAIDTALASRVGLPSDSKSTYYLENMVFLELLRRGGKVFYWQSDSSEIDFVVETAQRERALVQVCWSLDAPDTERRETFAFEDFSLRHKNLKIQHRTIVTMQGNEKTLANGVQAMPFYLWALLD